MKRVWFNPITKKIVIYYTKSKINVKCLNPITVKGRLMSCGKCLACRANKVNEHIFRSNQEIKDSIVSYFITFTFDSDKFDLPQFGFTKDDGSKIIKLIKKKVACKYTLVYEYGGRFSRPHFHANIYCKESISWSEMLDICKSAWKFGNVYIKEINDKENYYVAKWHVTCTLFDDVYRIKGTDSYINGSVYRDIVDGKIQNGSVIPVGFKTWFRVNKDAEYIKQFPTYRLTSKGIGIGYLDSDEYQQRCLNGQYYIVNNKGQRNFVPRYYRSKMNHSFMSKCDCELIDAFIKREPDAIDRLADKMENQGISRRKAYKDACYVNGATWYKNYKSNMIKSKLHGNEKNEF